jgi:curved DNA-binding protein
MKIPDYYATLGVDKTASADDIKKSFRRLARKYHPDISKEPDAAAQMAAINEANDVLSNPEKRKAYDQVGHQAWAQGARSADDARPPPGWHQGYEQPSDTSGFSHDHSEFFDELFGRAAHERSRHKTYSSSQNRESLDGQDQHVDITLPLAEVFTGTTRSLRLESYEVDDQGQLVPRTRTLEVNIPLGVTEGQLIRLSGQGAKGFGNGKPGDLYLRVHIEASDGYVINGRDITMPVFVSPWEAALGSDIVVNSPAGSLSVTVPAGSVAGRRLRLKGKGIPAGRSTTPPGDLYIDLRIAVPSAVTEDQRKAWQALADAYPGFEARAK